MDRIRREAFKKATLEMKKACEKLSKVKHKIAVLSVKGGVGKSFVTANLAVALAIRKRSVGVFDADVHGPSIPRTLGLIGLQLYVKGENIIPVEGPLGVKVISVGFMLPDETVAVIWRGPLKTAYIRQALAMTEWGNLDYLLIDLPPGTGDEQLTIAQLISGLDGLLLVTLPNLLSEKIVAKAKVFAERLNVKILGVIENMSYFKCPDTGKIYYIFGKGGGLKLADEVEAPLLASIPIDPRITETMDKGKPFVLEYPNSEVSKIILETADKIIKLLESS